MDYSRKISERQWNLPDKGELESRREATYIDDIIQKDHIQRKLLENLDGIRTVFDGGAGCGRFSILLAKQGCRVTHFDISRPMIDKAKELAEKEGVLDRITFVQGALEDLGAYRNRDFAEAEVTRRTTVSRAMEDIFFDPQTSGGLLIAVAEKDAAALAAELAGAVPGSAVIGYVTEREETALILEA